VGKTSSERRNRKLQYLGAAAAGIAHDLNNELMLVVNYLEAGNRNETRAAAERCVALTGSILEFCREQSVSTGDVDAANFLRQFCQNLQLPGGVHLELDTVAAPPIQADTLALRRVISNLVRNACDAMRGVGTLRLTSGPDGLTVVDSGPGVQPELARKIFQPFFSTKGGRGSGLGLATVHELMRLQGGSVTLLPARNGGACFLLRFQDWN